MLMSTYTGRLSTSLLLLTWIADRSSSKILARANAGLAMRRLSFLPHSNSPASHQPASAGFPWSSRRPSCSSTCIGLSQSRWRPYSGALYSSGCTEPSKVFGRTGLRDGLLSDACPETCIAADSDSKAHSGPCYGGLGPASQPLSVPPQRQGHPFFLNHRVLRCQRICIVRVV